jgi:hypothetical protein
MRKILLVKLPRHRRALKWLLEKEVVTVKNMELLCGALNSRQVIMELRELGVDVKTRRFSMTDRDGRKTRPGEYFLLPEEKERVADFLSKKTATESANSMARDEHDFQEGV